ncbi:hypothetical protein ZT10_004694, partial [Salmonella enterica subsp. enterica]|nr:hypothetical protein [Salmonella enterica]EDY0579532.1 hypothetical protein [Salmonella enterica subsp. enterica serovar Goldcoast]EFD0293643.1 hypothetical protein [Escherichia coli]EFN7996184.1 hypothetical protein [Escherichia coli]
SVWGLTYLKLSAHFWGSRESYFGLVIAGIFFLIMHCRYCAKNVVIKNDGLAPMRELINIGVSLDIENYCTVSLFFEQTYLWQ